VAVAARVRRPVFVPGHIGRRAAEAGFRLSAEQTIEVSNEWGFMLERLAERPLEALLVVGHPGKLGKLAAGEWDTHSARSGSVLPALQRLVTTVGGVPVPPPPAGVPAPPPPTAEGLFRQLPAAVRRAVADRLAEQIAAAVRARLGGRVPVAVRLVDYEGATLGEWGDLTPWQQ
jgi:cobalt-precorrin-5B (C1)-methyltransferase